MAFRKLNNNEKITGCSFNTAFSSNFKDIYDKLVLDEYNKSQGRIPSQTFAPSSIRCKRVSYFRLKGVEPDIIEIDPKLQFCADSGTDIHRRVQSLLKYNFSNSWVPVSEFLDSNYLELELTLNSEDEFESKLECYNPPIKFACDGILKNGNEYVLLEIKTCDPKSFKSLSDIKPNHIDQVKCYCTILNIKRALVLYIDRLWGDSKCYELNISHNDRQHILDDMNEVMRCVEDNIVPEGLPSGDYWCSYCKYKKRCKEWG